MIENLQKLKDEVLAKVAEIKDSSALQDLEKKYLGRKGELTAILRGLTELDAEDLRILYGLSRPLLRTRD